MVSDNEKLEFFGIISTKDYRILERFGSIAAKC
jgi:hypothetical protein